MELVLSGFIAGAFFILMIIMFWLGYKEAYRHKVEDPVKIEEFYAGEGWDNDTLLPIKRSLIPFTENLMMRSRSTLCILWRKVTEETSL